LNLIKPDSPMFHKIEKLFYNWKIINQSSKIKCISLYSNMNKMLAGKNPNN